MSSDDIVLPTLQREGGLSVERKIKVLREAWAHYQMAVQHKMRLKYSVSKQETLHMVVGTKALEEALSLVKNSLIYQVKELGQELAYVPDDTALKKEKKIAERLIKEITSGVQSHNQNYSPNTYESVYQKGFTDGFAGRNKHERPSLMRSVLSDTYRKKYHDFYNDGFYAGVRERRKIELAKILPSRSKSKSQLQNRRDSHDSHER